MSVYLAAYLIVLVLACWRVYRVGDNRDIGAAMVVTMQALLTILWGGDMLVAMAVHFTALWLFVFFSVKAMGIALGGIAGLQTIWAGLAWAGVIPHDSGAGVAWNYHHHVTIMMYVQLAMLATMAGRRDDVAA